MEDIRVKKLREEWKNFENNWNSEAAKKEYNSFITKYSNDNFNLELDNYTNIKENEETEYFTHFIERKTENCGKFRTSSSFAYGVYRVNIKNIDEKKYLKEHEYVRTENFKDGVYRSSEQKRKKEFKDKYITKKEAEIYFKDKVLPRIQQLIKFEKIEDIKPLDINYARKVAYMYNPDKLIPIYKNDVIQAIAEFFSIEDIDLNSYKATNVILDKFIKIFGIEEEELPFEMTQKIGSFLWTYFGKSVSFDSKNIIFYGAPGTGKTYTVKNTVKQRVLIAGDNEDEVALFTQFHPSFSYEDFIEGLKPHIKKGATELKLTDGIFKKFCKKAMNKLKEERKENLKDDKLTKFYFIVDEINRAELSTVFGELLVCLEEDKRVDLDEKGNITEKSMLIETQYSYLIENEKDALITINGKHKFGIPSNLYFIGTMNDIDRSIDSFDLALRRRFIWERMDCDYEVIANDDDISMVKQEEIEAYIDSCKALNKYISEDLALGKSYEIGHSYFMDVKVSNKTISKSNKEKLFNTKLKPLIEEYLRAEYNLKDIEEKIKIAKAKFGLK